MRNKIKVKISLFLTKNQLKSMKEKLRFAFSKIHFFLSLITIQCNVMKLYKILQLKKKEIRFSMIINFYCHEH